MIDTVFNIKVCCTGGAVDLRRRLLMPFAIRKFDTLSSLDDFPGWYPDVMESVYDLGRSVLLVRLHDHHCSGTTMIAMVREMVGKLQENEWAISERVGCFSADL